MGRRQLVPLFCILLAGVWLAGCASPHYLALSPTRTAEVPPLGNGQSVSVFAKDARDSDVIGHRTGQDMSTSVITLDSHQLMPKLQEEAERAVADIGFTPTQERSDGRPILTLELASLNYTHGDSSQLGLNEANIEGVLRAIVQHQGTTYTSTYTSRRVQSYAVKPGQGANTRMLNELLSDALNRALSDRQLGELLAQ